MKPLSERVKNGVQCSPPDKIESRHSQFNCGKICFLPTFMVSSGVDARATVGPQHTLRSALPFRQRLVIMSSLPVRLASEYSEMDADVTRTSQCGCAIRITSQTHAARALALAPRSRDPVLMPRWVVALIVILIIIVFILPNPAAQEPSSAPRSTIS